MKKLSLVAVMAILLVCVISNPVWTRAENCVASDDFVGKYFNLVNGLPYTEENNIITFHIKNEYAKYMEIYVNDSFSESGNEHDGAVTPDANGNVTLDLVANQNAGYADTNIRFYFTADPSLFPDTAANCGKVFRQYTFSPGSDDSTDENDEELAAMERELGTLPTTGPSIEDLKDSSFISVSDPTQRQSLSCNYGKNDGKTIKKYSYTGVSSKTDTCTTTCREDVIVTLDPPVITQSGMCFSYVVDIKTKTVCSSNFSGTPPTKIVVKNCKHNINCSSQTDKGGPNDSFDSCVNSCDGGKYTQSCVDKCYTKVYGKTSDSTVQKTTKSSAKEEAITYLNNLKATNSFEEPTKLASLKTVNVGVKSLTCYTDKYLANSTKNLNDAQLTELAKKVYESKQYLPGGYYNNAGTKWISSGKFFSYDTNGGTWKWNSNGGCASNISSHYFTSVAKTKLTIKELNGSYYYPGTSRIHRYVAKSGYLRRSDISYDGGKTWIDSNCGESCSMTKQNCPNLSKKGDKQYIVTQTQANNIYKAELKAYTSAKSKCVASSNSCVTRNSNYVIKTDETSKNTGKNLGQEYKSTQNVNQAKTGNKSSSGGSFPSMIINTNGVCITGECENKNQEYCSNLDKNSSEYIAYCKDKESCKNSGTPACKNGNTCYDYHTTLSFPKNYINVKTGQTTTQVKKEDLPFYVAIGNSYCTSLSTKEVNVDWYNYKIDDTNTVAKPSKINKYNITGQINNYGVHNWNFDFSCFFAIKNPTSGDCTGDECDGNKKCVGENCNSNKDGEPSDNIISNVKVRSVNLSNLFPNRNARFNWSVNAKNVNNKNYKVDPEALIKSIETTGDSVYDENNENKYLDYEINLTRSAINTIREYNKGKTYNNSDNGTGVDRLSGQGTWGVTVYQSSLLDSLGTSVVKKRGLLGCNNQTSAETCNVEGGN